MHSVYTQLEHEKVALLGWKKSFHMSAASRRGAGAGERRLPFARTAGLRGEACHAQQQVEHG